MNESMNFELSDPYRRIRKIHIFFSAVLLFWEFLEVNIHNVSSNGIYINIDAPHVVPSILFLIVAYFGYRLYTEWGYHTQKLRRAIGDITKAHRLQSLDYHLSQMFGLFSIIIYFIQNTFNFQIIELFTLDIVPTFSLIVIIIYFMQSIFVSFVNLKAQKFKYKKLNKRQKSYVLIRIGMIILFMPMVYVLGLLSSVKIYFMAITIYYVGYFLFKAFQSYFGDYFRVI